MLLAITSVAFPRKRFVHPFTSRCPAAATAVDKQAVDRIWDGIQDCPHNRQAAERFLLLFGPKDTSNTTPYTEDNPVQRLVAGVTLAFFGRYLLGGKAALTADSSGIAVLDSAARRQLTVAAGLGAGMPSRTGAGAGVAIAAAQASPARVRRSDSGSASDSR
jgi:hypothetical protein